jgi:sulfatase maturation enzyme AslB (radical SAM superfamily)
MIKSFRVFGEIIVSRYFYKFLNPAVNPIRGSLVLLLSSWNFWKTCYRFFFKRRLVLSQASRHATLPRVLYFELTNTCNAACVFCPYPVMQRPKRTMDMDLFCTTVSQYTEMGGTAIGFTPIVGDPLLDKLLEDRLKYLSKKPEISMVSFYTNSIGLTKSRTQSILAAYDFDLHFNISFGGEDRESFNKIMGVDQYDRVVKNLTYFFEELLTKNHSKLIVKADFRCPSEWIGSHLGFVFNECRSRGLIKVSSIEAKFDSFGGYIDQDRLDSVDMGLRMRFGYPKMGPCEIPFLKPIVMADGSVNACAERDLEATLNIGSVNTSTLSDVLSSRSMQYFKNRFGISGSLPDVCSKCTVYQSIFDPRSKVWSESLSWSPKCGN